jgi:serine/threonine-protein kinase HipA
MGRRPVARDLRVLVNGRSAGLYRRAASGAVSFSYDAEWLADIGIRLSLSLPLREGAQSGTSVISFFENLLPDNEALRRQIAERMQAGGTDPHTLLAAIGRDCVGALQFLPVDAEPGTPFRIEGEEVGDAEIGSMLADLGRAPLGMEADAPFRISLAGAQEKTALLRWNGKWLRPFGLTPTTHIFKRPMGVLQSGIDMTDSVENEHLCARIAAAFGLPVAPTRMARFGDQKVLIIERFDRVIDDRTAEPRILRQIQEDFLQACGLPSVLKYQSDGGPGISDGLRLVWSGTDPTRDAVTFLKAQILFWLIGATDGHAKNFSLFHSQSGHRLTPLYDILSAAPALAAGRLRHNQFQMAMALGNRRHYRMDKILPHHFQQTVAQNPIPAALLTQAMTEIAAAGHTALAAATQELGTDFPDRVASPIIEMAQRRLANLDGHLMT